RKIIVNTPARKPFIDFLGRGVQAGRLVLLPGIERVLPKTFALFLAFDILRYSLAHNPVRGTLTGFGKSLHTSFQFVIELDGCCGCHVLSAAKGITFSDYTAYISLRRQPAPPLDHWPGSFLSRKRGSRTVSS